jgi:hypothetical protein
MALQHLPLSLIGFAGLVQYRPWNSEFPDVVQESRPPQAVPVGFRQLQFICDQIGHGSDSLRVPPGQSVVPVQRGGQGQDVLGRDTWLVDFSSALTAFG